MVSVLFNPCRLASIPLIAAYVGGQKSAGLWFRRGAGLVIVLLGVYFITGPFFSRY
jgi:hypothetical protein